MFDQLPVSPPISPYDYLAIKDAYSQHMDELEPEWMSSIYGLSSLERFRDHDFCRQVEDWLEASPDPVRQRFEFGYLLSAYLDGDYFYWTHRRLPSEPNVFQYEALLPEDPEYPGEIPEWVYNKTVAWLLAGIAAFRDDKELMDKVHQIKYRWLGGYTFLKEQHIQQLEAALGYEVRLETDPRAQARIRRIVEAIQQDNERQDDGPSSENNVPA